MKRKARPLGLTMLIANVHNHIQLDDKAIHQIINYSLNYNLCYNNKPATIEVLANLLGLSKAQAYKHYIEHTARVANLVNPKDIHGLYLGQIFDLLAGASGTLRDIRSQKAILQAAQGNDYVPFLTEQVNSILGTEMAAYEKMAKMAESLTKGINPNALPQPAEQSGPDAKPIGVNEALKLLEANKQLTLSYGEEHNKPLAQAYLTEAIPEVRANRQVGNTDDAALVKMHKKHHTTRRAKELDIDEEES